MELINILLIALLLLLVRKLAWCLRWLWCYYHSQELPAPIPCFPRPTREIFDGHIRQAQDTTEE